LTPLSSLNHHTDSLSIDSIHTPTNRPLSVQEQVSLQLLARLKQFLATAPTRWSPPPPPNSSSTSTNPTPTNSVASIPFPNPLKHPALNRFALPSGEYVTCVLWEGLYYISGTDIVRALVFRFEAFGRPIRNMKKFEEGVFSDLRNLKPGLDACLEDPKVSLFCSFSCPSPVGICLLCWHDCTSTCMHQNWLMCYWVNNVH
jgi:transcription factor STE12